MELHEYTDEQLRAEIRRRAAIKAKQTRETSKREKYIYWEGIVSKILPPRYDDSLYSIEFYIDPLTEYLQGKMGIWSRFKLVSGFGFNKSNMPKVGDKVKLRYRNGKKHEAIRIYDSRIIEVIERKNKAKQK